MKNRHVLMLLCECVKMKGRYSNGPCGNVIARREGEKNDLPPVLMGSHLDTVYQAGKYDGVVGVTAALEVVKRLNEKGMETDIRLKLFRLLVKSLLDLVYLLLGVKQWQVYLIREK